MTNKAALDAQRFSVQCAIDEMRASHTSDRRVLSQDAYTTIMELLNSALTDAPSSEGVSNDERFAVIHRCLDELEKFTTKHGNVSDCALVFGIREQVKVLKAQSSMEKK